MKMLMVSANYPPIMRGGANYVQWLSQELVTRGHQVVVCTLKDKRLSESEQDDGVKVQRLDGAFQKIPFLFSGAGRHPPAGDYLITRQLRRILENEKPDIVHSHGRIVYSLLSAKEKYEVPLVSTLHGYALICPKITLMRGTDMCTQPFTTDCVSCGRSDYSLFKSLIAYQATRLNRDKLRSVDKFIAVSPFVKQVHQDYLELNERDIEAIPDFYAPESSPQVKSKSLPKNFILFVGSLTPVKGVDVLVEAYRKLQPETRLLIIGSRHAQYRYQNTGNIIFMENVQRELLLAAYQKCRFAIFPSIWPEPFGIVSIEAMSYRKAVIASRIGGLSDIVVDGETGILVQPNEVAALSQAIDYLLKNPDVADSMGEKGYERWRQLFTPEAVIPRIEKLYHEVSHSHMPD